MNCLHKTNHFLQFPVNSFELTKVISILFLIFVKKAMENIIAKFEPIYSSNQTWLITGILSASLCWIGLAFLLSEKKIKLQYNQRMLLALLVFIGGITFSGMAFFSGWAMARTGTVTVYSNSFETGGEIYAYQQIRKIYKKDDKQTSPINPAFVQRNTELLFVELKSGKILVLSSKDYETNKIFNALQRAMDSYKKG